ncbi:MAG: CopG family transcriptional regulator [Elusimicrobia bacterium]|nr:CopG family transcriptional regulator [Elusimicrobiota bacterium]
MAKARKDAPLKKNRRRVTTVYMDLDVSKAAKMKAAVTGMSVSDQVNEALRERLREDERDLEMIKRRRHEPSIPYEEFLADMKRRGLL